VFDWHWATGLSASSLRRCSEFPTIAVLPLSVACRWHWLQSLVLLAKRLSTSASNCIEWQLARSCCTVRRLSSGCVVCQHSAAWTENKLPSTEHRGQADRVAILTNHDPNLNSDPNPNSNTWPWAMTTFNPRRAACMVMTHTHANNRGERSVVSKTRVETDGRTDTIDCSASANH